MDDYRDLETGSITVESNGHGDVTIYDGSRFVANIYYMGRGVGYRYMVGGTRWHGREQSFPTMRDAIVATLDTYASMY